MTLKKQAIKDTTNNLLRLKKNSTMNGSSTLNSISFKRLPKVPMTKYLETKELKKDILFCGYKPIMYPVKENPLFRNTKIINNILPDLNKKMNSSDKDGNKNSIPTNGINEELYGFQNNGGIKSVGINGTWKFSPTIPSDMLPYNWWITSVLAMEFYPEWGNIPKEVLNRLKPFDRHK